MPYASFDAWMNEIEGFGTRAERAAEEVSMKWLQAAWQLATEAERERCKAIALRVGSDLGESAVGNAISKAING